MGTLLSVLLALIAAPAPPPVVPGRTLRVVATAYCQTGKTQSGVRVRYRVDGDLHTSVILPLSTHRALAARIKVLSSIRLDERRKPQDGRFSASIDGREIDFRVSTFPSYYGEKIVIRILDHKQGFIALDKIGQECP